MKRRPASFDVVVMGGGPAGAAVALKTARLGHDVCLVERDAGTSHGGFAQSLAPSILPLLDALGVREDVESARFPRCRGVSLLWGDARTRYREFENGEGFHIERSGFDRILRAAAARSGAVVLCPAKVLGAERTLDQATAWTIRLAIGADVVEIRTRILVDAMGRKSTLPARQERISPPLLAILGQWRAAGSIGPQSVAEAGADRWYWAGPQCNGHLTAAVFFDPRSRLLPRRTSLATAYRALVDGSRLLRHIVGELQAPVMACDATSRRVHEPLEPDLLRVGEVAVSLDPLSSQGIQAALTGALQAAIVLNTWLARPRCAAAADAFYRERHAEMVRHGEQNRRRIYAEAAGRFETAFWQERSSPQEPTVSSHATTRTTPLPDPLARLRLADGVRVKRMAVARDDFAEFAPAVAWQGAERPVAFLGDLPVGALAARLVTGAPAMEVVRSWSEVVGEAHALKALGWMWQMAVVRDQIGFSRDPVT